MLTNSFTYFSHLFVLMTLLGGKLLKTYYSNHYPSTGKFNEL